MARLKTSGKNNNNKGNNNPFVHRHLAGMRLSILVCLGVLMVGLRQLNNLQLLSWWNFRYDYDAISQLGSIMADQQQKQYTGNKAGDQHISNNGDTINPNHYSSSSSSSWLLQQPPYTLNDATIRLSPYVDHPWLRLQQQQQQQQEQLDTTTTDNNKRPRQKLILTDMEWNHPDRKVGLGFPRSMRSRELLQAFVDHPLFDPSFKWSEEMKTIQQKQQQRQRDNNNANNATIIDPAIEWFVLMDVETCFDINYPNYGEGLKSNADTQGGRVVDIDYPKCFGIGGCDAHIMKVLESPLFQEINNNNGSASLLYWDCGGDGFDWNYRQLNPSPNLYIFSLSSGGQEDPPQIITKSDMGLPPPAIRPVWLTEQQRQAIQSCESDNNNVDEKAESQSSIEKDLHRPYLFTFVGSNSHWVREKLWKLHNGEDVISFEPAPSGEQQPQGILNETYATLLHRALFSGVPRGDNLFSYRLTEVLSAGAIPVIYADKWMLPFHKDLIDWSKCAVVIPEAQAASQTLQILRQISPAQRCKMRQYCYFNIYLKYMVNPEANIAGVLDSIEVAKRIERRGR